MQYQGGAGDTGQCQRGGALAGSLAPEEEEAVQVPLGEGGQLSSAEDAAGVWLMAPLGFGLCRLVSQVPLRAGWSVRQGVGASSLVRCAQIGYQTRRTLVSFVVVLFPIQVS
uniref:Uncharacterized protein n=1 Tax=Cercocebus atys TaxID=9531 RepID=A0A2K5L002_CERAT